MICAYGSPQLGVAGCAEVTPAEGIEQRPLHAAPLEDVGRLDDALVDHRLKAEELGERLGRLLRALQRRADEGRDGPLEGAHILGGLARHPAAVHAESEPFESPVEHARRIVDLSVAHEMKAVGRHGVKSTAAGSVGMPSAARHPDWLQSRAARMCPLALRRGAAVPFRAYARRLPESSKLCCFSSSDLGWNVGGPRQNEGMESPIEPLSDLRTQVAEALRGVSDAHLLHHASDADLAAAIAIAGDIARLVEGVLIDGVAELAERSGSRATDERLTTRLGCHNLNELIQRLTRCSAQTAARLERAQRAVAPDLGHDHRRRAPRPAARPPRRRSSTGMSAPTGCSRSRGRCSRWTDGSPARRCSSRTR